jgi:hypothetical protein
MVLGGNQHLPVVLRRVGEVGTGVADEVPQDMLLQLRLAVRRACPTELVETGEERPGRILIAPVNSTVAPPARPGIRLGRSDLIDEIAEAPDDDFGDWH